MFKQNISLSQLHDTGEVICFAAKWHDRKAVEFYSVHDDRDEMIEAAWRLIDEADAIVTYNGKPFDLPHLNRLLAVAGKPPPSPHKDIDLLRTVRRKFRMPSNKLDHVLGEFELERKVDTGGFELWRDCMAGDAKAWAKMRRYNVQDVRATEALYDRLLPWIDQHPHPGLYGHNVDEAGQVQCQRCGSTELRRKGYAYTPLGKYQQYRCNECGSWSRGKTALATVGVRGVA